MDENALDYVPIVTFVIHCKTRMPVIKTRPVLRQILYSIVGRLVSRHGEMAQLRYLRLSNSTKDEQILITHV